MHFRNSRGTANDLHRFVATPAIYSSFAMAPADKLQGRETSHTAGTTPVRGATAAAVALSAYSRRNSISAIEAPALAAVACPTQPGNLVRCQCVAVEWSFQRRPRPQRSARLRRLHGSLHPSMRHRCRDAGNCRAKKLAATIAWVRFVRLCSTASAVSAKSSTASALHPVRWGSRRLFRREADL